MAVGLTPFILSGTVFQLLFAGILPSRIVMRKSDSKIGMIPQKLEWLAPLFSQKLEWLAPLFSSVCVCVFVLTLYQQLRSYGDITMDEILIRQTSEAGN